jgi:hypothetical protein
MVVVSGVLPRGHGVRPLQGSRAELLWPRFGEGEPESFGRFHVGGLVYLQLKGQIGTRDACRVEEKQEE